MFKNFWYAVEFSERVTRNPIGVTVMGQRLALYRTPGGSPAALADRCAHRGASLSSGTLKGDCLACPYHGWEYAPDGRCTRIPANPPQRPVPGKARVGAYPVQERYGFIWVFIGDASHAEHTPLPNLPELEDLKERGGRFRAVKGDFRWNANYERVLENGCDIAHGPFVHAASFGDPQQPEIPEYELEHPDDASAFMSLELRPPPPTGLWGMLWKLRGGSQERPPVRLTMGWILPNLLKVTLKVKLGEMVTYSANIPVDEATTLTKFISLRSFLTTGWADRSTLARIMNTYREDQRVLELVRPWRIPLDLSAELNVRSDLIGVAYRRRRRELAEEGRLIAAGLHATGSRSVPLPENAS